MLIIEMIVWYASRFEQKRDELQQQDQKYFVLILSGGGSQGQNIQYACCLQRSVGIVLPKHGLIRSVQVCYCVITRKPVLSFFEEVLSHIACMHADDCEKGKPEHLLNMVSDKVCYKLRDCICLCITLLLFNPTSMCSLYAIVSVS